MSVRWRIKKGDTVVVIAGKDKGKSGEVLEVDRQNFRVTVKGVNVLKRHNKPSASSPGGVTTFEGFIHVSNVNLADPETQKPTRVGVKKDESGRKMRVAKRSGKTIDE